MDLGLLIILIPIVLLSLSVHEFAHGWMADKLGDPTPRSYGRLTLNPLAHLDIMGTLVLIITQRFGWAKPVPINPNNFRNSSQGMIKVGLAGPVSNLLLALLAVVILRLLLSININVTTMNALIIALQINIALAVFNLIPLPPLDGSKVLAELLPNKYAYQYTKIATYGPIILLILVATGIMGMILLPMINVVYRQIFLRILYLGL